MMLACKFGCDYLFEVGFIGVNGGKLLVSPALQDQVAIQYSEKIKGRAVSVSEKQSRYFEWHYEKRFINLIK